MPLVEGPGRFFNQCIQKKGLTDFTDGMLVAVIGGCEGSAVLAVVELNTKVTSKLLQALSNYQAGLANAKAILKVVELEEFVKQVKFQVVRHRLQLSPQQLSGVADGEGSEGGCEGGACQYRSLFWNLPFPRYIFTSTCPVW